MIKYDKKNKVYYIKFKGRKITGHNKELLRSHYNLLKYNNR
jgi:hypothetical protein